MVRLNLQHTSTRGAHIICGQESFGTWTFARLPKLQRQESMASCRSEKTNMRLNAVTLLSVLLRLEVVIVYDGAYTT
jgi:hypothetical protein